MKNKNWWKNVFSVNHETPVVHKNTCSIKHLLRDIVLGDKSTHTKITSPYVNKYLNLEMHVYKKYILYKSSKKKIVQECTCTLEKNRLSQSKNDSQIVKLYKLNFSGIVDENIQFPILQH